MGIGVVGCGYWGPNLIRNFHQLRGSRVVQLADLDEKRLNHMEELYPEVQTTTDYEQLVQNDEIDAVVVATPVDRHAEVGLAALQAGKHVLVEKPMTRTSEEARRLIDEAKKRDRVLMVGHVFEFTESVRKCKSILDDGTLGDLYYINSQRLNLGLFRNDVNVIWDLAPHDFSILLNLLGGKRPRGVRAIGASHINPQVEDVATMTLDFDGGLVAFVQVSWLDPKKVRQTVLVGSKKMLIYNDIEPTEKLWLYDRSVEGPAEYETYAQFPYTYRYGDITVPRIGGAEPLRTEAQHFLDCINSGKTPLTDGHSGLRVVEVLESTDRSLSEGGARIELPA
ncbi:MAG: Gfo/Idh/MocA family oxidoreductase [Acidobacteriota bacterium]|nr:MAG: Gfo/Idh/MocA family oxidoreductase [Acidobacteriota bacterium]